MYSRQRSSCRNSDYDNQYYKSIIWRKVLFTQFTYRANITITRNLLHKHPHFFSDIIPHSNCPSCSLPAADKQNCACVVVVVTATQLP